MSKLKPFDPAATCPKCGYDDVRVFYQRGACPSPAPCGVGWQNSGEHLDRVCQRCHYIWAEACLATTTAPAADIDAAAGETGGVRR